MRTSKWLASSVILFILLRVFVRSAPVTERGSYASQNENDSGEKALSRGRRFSMNEYLMIAISVFNIFVLLYNNIETFFPARISLSKTIPNVPDVSVNLNQVQPDTILPESTVEAPIATQSLLGREDTIDQIAEMLIR